MKLSGTVISLHVNVNADIAGASDVAEQMRRVQSATDYFVDTLRYTQLRELLYLAPEEAGQLEIARHLGTYSALNPWVLAAIYDASTLPPLDQLAQLRAREEEPVKKC